MQCVFVRYMTYARSGSRLTPFLLVDKEIIHNQTYLSQLRYLECIRQSYSTIFNELQPHADIGDATPTVLIIHSHKTVFAKNTILKRISFASMLRYDFILDSET